MRIFTAVLATGFFLGACGNGAGTTTARDTPRTTVTQEQLEKVLLAPDDVPTGYLPSDQTRGPADIVLCRGLAELREGVARGVAASARFTGPDLISTVGQETYFDPAGTRGVAHLRKIFAACDETTTTIQGQQVTLEVAEQPLDGYGEESAAFRVSGSVMGLRFSADFAAVGLGGVVNLVYAAGVGPDHTDELENLVEVTYHRQERLARP